METGHEPLLESEVVCPKCLYANPPEEPFCLGCGAPIGMVANVDPIQSIQAEGFGYRSAADGPPRLIIVIGIWLIFLSMGGTALAVLALSRGINPLSVLSLALLLISIAILYRVTHNYIVKSRDLRQAHDA